MQTRWYGGFGRGLRGAVAVLASLGALTGCGGGGGGSDGGAGSAAAAPAAATASVSAPKTIDADRGRIAASDGWRVLQAVQASGISAATPFKSAGEDGAAPGASLASLGLDQLLAIADASDPSLKIVSNVTTRCDGGGTVAVVFHIARRTGAPSVGDTGTLSYAGCVQGGATLDGGYTFTVTRVAGSRATPTMSVAAQFRFDLRVSDAAGVASYAGDLTMDATLTTRTPYQLDLAVTGPAFTVTEGQRKVTLSSYRVQMSIDDTAGTFSQTIAGTLTSSRLSEALVLSTPTPLAGALGASPRAGQFRLAAGDGTSVRVTAEPELSAGAASSTLGRIDVDSNADGVYEAWGTTPWPELSAH